MRARGTWSRPLLSLAALGLISSAAYTTEAAATPAVARAAVQTTLYASPSGSGTACSSTSPCSLTAARSAVESVNGSMSGDIVVYLMGGTYRLASTFQLGPQDSGTNGHTVYWEAYPGQTPVIEGSQQVTGWSQYNAGLNIWRAPVAAGTQARDLWVDGARAAETKSAINPGGFSQSGASFTTSDGSYRSWIDPTEAEIVDNNPWRQLRCPLASITASGSGSSLNVNQACYNATLSNVGFPFNGSGFPTLNHITWIENAYALLTRPGQWFLDSAGGYLYYIPVPGQSMPTADVELPVVQDLVDVQGSPGHLAPVDDTASGISYSGSGWGYSSGRGLGDFQNDVHSTQNNGDSVSYSFTGSGVTALTELSSDEGTIAVYIDGALNQTVNAATSGQRVAEDAVVTVTGLTPGSHSVKLVKQSGTWMLLDGFVVIPTAIQPAHDITFSGITFQYNTWLAEVSQGYPDNQTGIMWSESNPWYQVKDPGMINVERGSDITFTGDTIAHSGDTGVDLGNGTQNSTLSNSRILDIAINAVQIGEVDDYYLTATALMTSGDTVTGNFIEHSGVVFQSTSGILAGYTRNVTISHNDVGYSAAQGISVGWGWGYASPYCSGCAHGYDYAGGNQVSYNYVYDNGLGDGAGNTVMAECIYTLGGQGEGNGSAWSTLIGNVCQDQYIYSNWGTIAHDEGSSYWQDHDNVIRWSGQDWMFYDQPTVNNITVGPNNYADNPTYRAVVPNNTSFTQATIVPNGQWPAGAQAVITSAGPPAQVAPLTGTLDDTCLCLNYTGTSWSWSGDRGLGDYDNAVHQATGNGDSFSVQFTGTGVSWTGEKSSGEGTAEVYLDGADKGSVNANSSTTQAQQTLYSVSGLTSGTHTLKVVKTGGTYLQVDAVNVTGTAVVTGSDSGSTGGTGSYPSGYHALGIASNNLCLDDYGATSTAGAIIDQWSCNSGTNQQFQFVPTSGGYGELQVRNSGQDVAVLNSSTAQGTPDIVQEPVNGNAASQWLPQQQSDGSWQFKNQNSGLCLDVYGNGSNTGQQLDQWPCKNTPGTNQDFKPE